MITDYYKTNASTFIGFSDAEKIFAILSPLGLTIAVCIDICSADPSSICATDSGLIYTPLQKQKNRNKNEKRLRFPNSL